MLTVYKFAVPVVDDFELQLPDGAQILTVAAQHEKPQLWALVDTAAPTRPQRFRLAGTGHVLPTEPMEHVGSFQLFGGDLVFHLFRLVGKP